MFQDFMARGLYKTIDFLHKTGIEIPNVQLNLSKEEYLSITFYNLKEYKKVYYFPCCAPRKF
ncbi:cell division control protein CDC23 [Nosema bombycis CQ1]|uniref:Cell division control protein CDC23 n=1 Tax=Nosema bombycis (strain CQ1 / CVCC 102059) TaxID=578461 RepID=R0KV85_NOSB1|nr:cell division control protein CDC23 [Nosema bombycis CQ1]|eukprot:EOB14137.1 cell division control protein CDC23 [Nosema bombycis CQ1]